MRLATSLRSEIMNTRHLPIHQPNNAGSFHTLARQLLHPPDTTCIAQRLVSEGAGPPHWRVRGSALGAKHGRRNATLAQLDACPRASDRAKDPRKDRPANDGLLAGLSELLRDGRLHRPPGQRLPGWLLSGSPLRPL